MAGIKSINEKKAPLDSEMHVPKIATQAIAEPPKPTTTYFTNERVVAMMPFRDSIILVTERGAYFFDLHDELFKAVKFQIVEEPNE